MSKIRSVVHHLRDRLSSHKDDAKDLLSREQDVPQKRGGSQREVTRMIEEKERLSSETDGDEQSEDGHGTQKNLDDFLNESDPPEVRRRYGRLPLLQSEHKDADHQTNTNWTSLREINADLIGNEITFRARVHAVRCISRTLTFIVYRQQTTTVQAVLNVRDGQISESMVLWAQHIRPGSIVIVKAKVKEPEQEVRSASAHHVELSIEEMHVVSARVDQIPFTVYEMDAGNDSHRISDKVRFENRIVDLRSPTSQSIFRIQSAVCKTFRNYLDDHGFLEIHTPKLQGGATEGGADVFQVNYFGRKAFLAQSPQLAKQMCISADFGRVFEIGPVFRAENSNTPRHMTEYTGLDLELEIHYHYHEAMWLIDSTLKEIFKELYDRHRHEIDLVKRTFPHDDLVWLDKTPVITFAEGAKLLNDSGWTNEAGSKQPDTEDLPTRGERRLGEIVKEKFGTDYYILDKFPTSARPFYTMSDAKDNQVTNSFDFMVRGQEVLSGGQRVHDHEMLAERMRDSGMDPETLHEYLQGFKWVAPPHAGAGIGLERLVSLILDLGNLRYATLFPRDPKSFPSKGESNLRHPEDNTLQRRRGALPSLENLIANYGDATNTSWLDERFQIWRDEKTGAAIAYVPIHDRAILAGNPLCDSRQLEDVIGAFLKWLHRETKLKPLFILVDKDVESVLSSQMGWKSFTSVAEQRVNLGNNEHLNIDADVRRKIRHAQKEGLKVTEFGSDIPEGVQQRCNERIKDWQNSREGAQVHLSEILPFKDMEHRTFSIVEDGDGNIHSLVVLAQLAPRYGTQVKWALDFPDAVNGSIELNVQSVLKSAASAGNKTCTFGAGATAQLTTGDNLGNVKTLTLNSLYQTLAAKFSLEKKTGFRAKFNTLDDPLFLCYPPRGLGPKSIKAIIDFFKEDEKK